ncbi:MAG: TetR family transcriptional regulator [Alphaproteobacteria bacterium]|nr:TetR family transcriptional regulator [Alphaproteobacteria bacterium]
MHWIITNVMIFENVCYDGGMNESPRHAARRREVALAAARLLARKGIDGVTVRDVAAEVGFSTHVVSHYFRNKQELLLFTLRESSARSAARLDAAIAAGLDMQACLESLLPLDEARRTDCLVWFSFWAKAISDPELAEEQNRNGVLWRDRHRRLIGRRRLLLGLPGGDDELEAQRLQAVIGGIGIQACFDPAAWPPDRQRRLLAAEIEAICGTPDGPPPAVPKGTGIGEENERLRRLLTDALLENYRLRDRLDGHAPAGDGIV